MSGDAPPRSGVPRRTALAILVAVAASLALLVFPPVRRTIYDLRDNKALRRRLGMEIDPATGTGTLEDAQLAALEALGDVVFPGDYASGDELSRRARAFARKRTQQISQSRPGFYRQFVAGVDLLDSEARARDARRFAELDLAARRTLLGEILDPIVRGGDRPRRMNLQHLLTARQRWRVRNLWRYVVRRMLAEFWSSPLGWKRLGYPTVPGTCSNLVEFQTLPGSAERKA